jgi:conjugative transfer region lipoprotein (TIGR03751 family)
MAGYVREALGCRGVRSGEGDLAGYSREAFNELDVTFPRLPNPSLVMYVFPHLAGPERTPVPGYATTFPMYERIEYALPGEVGTPR